MLFGAYCKFVRLGNIGYITAVYIVTATTVISFIPPYNNIATDSWILLVRSIITNCKTHTSEEIIANKFQKKILLASTSEVYGKSENVPFCEDDDTVMGSTKYSRWSYACSKAIDEFLGMAYYEQYGLPVVIARFFNTVGPRQRGQYGMVVPRFVERALKNEPLLIYGTGKQRRCFGYVGDVVNAVVDLMDCPDGPGRV